MKPIKNTEVPDITGGLFNDNIMRFSSPPREIRCPVIQNISAPIEISLDIKSQIII